MTILSRSDLETQSTVDECRKDADSKCVQRNQKKSSRVLAQVKEPSLTGENHIITKGSDGVCPDTKTLEEIVSEITSAIETSFDIKPGITLIRSSTGTRKTSTVCKEIAQRVSSSASHERFVYIGDYAGMQATMDYLDSHNCSYHCIPQPVKNTVIYDRYQVKCCNYDKWRDLNQAGGLGSKVCNDCSVKDNCKKAYSASKISLDTSRVPL